MNHVRVVCLPLLSDSLLRLTWRLAALRLRVTS